jgi:hypothetical protein
MDGRSSNDASRETRRPVLEGVWASWNVYRVTWPVMLVAARSVPGLRWHILVCAGRTCQRCCWTASLLSGHQNLTPNSDLVVIHCVVPKMELKCTALQKVQLLHLHSHIDID